MSVSRTEWLPLGFNVPSPIEYEFQVIEYFDSNDSTKIKKVILQSRKIIFSNAGSAKEATPWTDVPRIRMPYVG